MLSSMSLQLALVRTRLGHSCILPARTPSPRRITIMAAAVMQVDDRSSTPTPSIARCIATLEGHEERVWHCAWSRDGRQLASCGSDRTVRLWRRTGDAFVTSATLDDAHDRTVRRVAWAPCGTLLAAISFDATCCVWRRSRQDDAWEILATLEGHENEVKGFTQRPSTKSHPPLITHRWRREIRAGAAAPTCSWRGRFYASLELGTIPTPSSGAVVVCAGASTPARVKTALTPSTRHREDSDRAPRRLRVERVRFIISDVLAGQERVAVGVCGRRGLRIVDCFTRPRGRRQNCRF